MWRVLSTRWVINDTNTTDHEGSFGIVDTGTTLNYLPPDVVNAYYDQVEEASYSPEVGAWVFPCDATLPSLGFGLHNAAVRISGKQINWGGVPGGSDYCYGGLLPQDDDMPIIYGDSFLSSHYVVFNYLDFLNHPDSPPSIGVALLNLPPEYLY